MKKTKNIKKIFCSRKYLLRDAFITALVIFAAATAVRAADKLDSSGVPAATGYTLGDIYTRLTTNDEATEADHDLSPSADPAATFYTLSQIYQAIPTINPAKLLDDTTYLGITGTITDVGQQILTPGTSNQTITEGFHDGTGYVSGDPDLISNNIRSGANLFGIDGNSNVVNTQTGDALASEILNGKIAWVDGTELTGSMTNVGTENFTPGTSNQTISEGYHNGTGIVDGDPDLTAGNIAANVDIFGVSGTLLENLYNGSATSPTDDFASYTQEAGGVDDYNAGGDRPEDAYAKNWTQCTEVNDYCDTNDAAACAGDICWKDDSTGVVWSDWLDGGNDHTWFWAHNCYEPETPTYNPGTCVNDGDDACICAKKPADSETGCEDLGDGNWRLPYQKELMQAYIDGSWGKGRLPNNGLPHAGTSFWSATTYSNTTSNAWRVYLTTGTTYHSPKTTSYASRCVYSTGN